MKENKSLVLGCQMCKEKGVCGNCECRGTWLYINPEGDEEEDEGWTTFLLLSQKTPGL